MAQCFKVPAALVEDLDKVPSILIGAHNDLNSSTMGSSALFWLQRVPGIHVVHIHTCMQNIHTHKIKN